MPKDFNYREKPSRNYKQCLWTSSSEMLPSRMRRSLKRGLSQEQRIVLEKLRKDDGKPVRTHARDLVIMPEMLGKTIHCYTGKEFKEITITKR